MSYIKERLNENVILIRDQYDESLYLIEGSQKALLIDTGMDQQSLYHYVQTLTDKDVIVVLTHGHIDHIGQTKDFADIYMDLRDQEIYKEHTHMKAGHFDSSKLSFKDITEIQEVPNSFDLGDIKIDVVHLSGHTAGSILLVDYEDKMVFTGDALGSGCGVWMQIDGTLHTSQYKKNLEKAYQELISLGVDEHYVFLGGHYGQEYTSQVSTCNKLDIQLMKDMIVLCEQLLDNKAELIEDSAMCATQAYYAHYGKAEMIINKENIK